MKKKDENISQYEEETTSSEIRRFSGIPLGVITSLTIAAALFHLYTAGFGVFPTLIQQGVHLAFVLCLIFLLYPLKKKQLDNKLPFYDIILSILGFISGFYIVINYDQIIATPGSIENVEIILGWITIILTLEATRRTMGLPLVIISVIALLYAYWGPYMPGLLAHKSYSMERVAEQMYITTNGIFNVPLGTSATVISLFVIFAAFLDKTGAGKTFMDIAFRLTGKYQGGPAKGSVFGSSIMGTVTGNSVSNVVTTGNFTIPLMKRTGYSAHFAGAIEAVASTGGQIMPPVMGAAAFIMADYTSVPYDQIIIAAFLPAVLFYTALFAFVHFRAKKQGIVGLSKEELPNLKRTIIEGFHLLIPLILLIYLLFRGFSPIYSAFYTIVLLVVLSMFKKSSRMNIRSIIGALDQGFKLILKVAIACATAGIVIGVLTLTGLATKFSSLLISLSGGSLVILLLLTMLASILLGMGLPTAPAYVLLAALVAPALTDAGLSMLAAHLFIFYFGILSTITPPIALSAYAAAGIANTNPNKVGYTSMMVGVVAYIVPFLFVFSPELLMKGTPVEIIMTLVFSMLGCMTFASSIMGYLLQKCLLRERAILLLTSIAFFYNNIIVNTFGLLILITIFFIQLKHNNSKLALGKESIG